jgi:hypothetical protein
VIRLGILGASEGNGHPWSFAAIINGYEPERFQRSGWAVIDRYLAMRDRTDFGFPGDVVVSHVWTQDPDVTRSLAESTSIAQVVTEPDAMIGAVDAVMILRDDHESHAPLALPFLRAGLPVFIDKPLCLSVRELDLFRPWLESGSLMSCSGLRFARELDPWRAGGLAGLGQIRSIHGSVVMDWGKYAIHIIEPLFSLVTARPVRVVPISARHDSVVLELSDESVFAVDCVGPAHKVFRLEVIGSEGSSTIEMNDNFTAFRRCIGRFLEMVKTREPPIPWADTCLTIQTLIAGHAAMARQQPVLLSEFAGVVSDA